MHVLIIPSWYFPKGSPDLHGRLFHQLALDLREKDVDARIFFADISPSGALFGKREFSEEEGVPTYRYSQFFLPKRNRYSLSAAIWLSARALNRCFKKYGNPSILHAQSWIAMFVAAEVSKAQGVSVLYTEHASVFLKREIPKWQLSFFKKYFPHLQQITVVSPGLADVFRPHVGKEVRVMPNYFDERIFRIQADVKKSKVFTWISVGEPAHTKGLDILLRAFALLLQKHDGHQHPMRLILVDDIREKEELVQLAASMGIDQHMEWKGVMPPEALAHLLHESHALISASRVETFGKTIMEAMACGVPVVATKTAGAAFIFGYSPHDRHGAGKDSTDTGELAEVDDVESLMKAMGRLYHGYDRFDPQKISKRVYSRFAKSNVIGQWIALYHQIPHDPD